MTLKTIRLPILRDESGIPLRLPDASSEELKTIYLFIQGLSSRFPDTVVIFSGPKLYITLPVPPSFEEFEALLLPIAERIRTIVLLWSHEISCYLDLCANLLVACSTDLVVRGEDKLVDEVISIWKKSQAR